MTIKEYLIGRKKKNISVLSQAITLIESTRNIDKKKGNKLIDYCLKEKQKSIKICVSGSPGVGKSTFIDILGNYLISQKKKIAVLAIDPSSEKSKGSILADKTRMEKLSSQVNAFIRPSPNKGSLGGITKTTRESIILCEHWGFDIIIIETVGVGQSEIFGYNISDFFILLALPKSGDQIQAIKKGIVEIADMIIIHKSDTINKIDIEREKNNYLHWQKKENFIEIFSSLKERGIEKIWDKVKHSIKSENNKKTKQINWLNEIIKENLEKQFYKKPNVKKELEIIKKNLEKSELNIKKIAEDLVKKYL